jgi:hypothetical protein
LWKARTGGKERCSLTAWNDYVTENNPVRVIEAFIDELDLATLGFDGVVPRPPDARLTIQRRY